MTYDRFEDTPVWRAAADLAAAIFDWVDHPAFRGRGDLADQLQRAAPSVSNKIAEGFERGTTSELIQFLYYARGSAGEVRSMLGVMERGGRFGDLLSQISEFKLQSESISRQIRGWANSLQNSDITGQRHLNDQSRRSYENRRRREAYAKRMDQFNQELLARLKAQRQSRQVGESPGDGTDGQEETEAQSGGNP
jgi:four helix bundle protein